MSDGYLGPYDGHGKRGRNLIARIKGLSESSSSPGEEDDDDDEVTNTGIFKSKAKTKYTAAGLCFHFFKSSINALLKKRDLQSNDAPESNIEIGFVLYVRF